MGSSKLARALPELGSCTAAQAAATVLSLSRNDNPCNWHTLAWGTQLDLRS